MQHSRTIFNELASCLTFQSQIISEFSFVWCISMKQFLWSLNVNVLKYFDWSADGPCKHSFESHRVNTLPGQNFMFFSILIIEIKGILKTNVFGGIGVFSSKECIRHFSLLDCMLEILCHRFDPVSTLLKTFIFSSFFPTAM